MAELNSRELATLRQAAMFGSLTDEMIRHLAAGCRKMTLRPGEPICRPDQFARCFFAILSGHVRIFRLAPSGDQQVLHLYGPGQTFAEAAAMKGMNYPAHAEAVGACTLLAIDKATFQKALRGNVEMVTGLVAGLSAKLKELASLAEELALKDAPARLARVLLEQARQAGRNPFRLSCAKRQIAESIGTAPETLSRALRKFQEDGLIAVDGAEVTILDASALADRASGPI